LVLGWEEIHDQISLIRALKKKTSLPVVLSRVNRNDAAKISGGRFNHLISHGFTLAELPELRLFIEEHPKLLDGVQITIPRSISPWMAARDLRIFKEQTNCRPILYVKSTEGSPAQIFNDEISNAHRFGEAVLSGVGHGIDVILDTFDDADRGYFTRTGLVDRRFNPHLSGQLVAELIRQLDQGTWQATEDTYPKVKDQTGRVLTIGYKSDIKNSTYWIDPATSVHGSSSNISKLLSEIVVLLTDSSLELSK
jgi:hypothetical protein